MVRRNGARHLQDWLPAHAHLTEALEAESDPWITQNRETLEDARAKVETMLGKVEVKGSPEGALVSVGGQVSGRLPNVLPVFVLPGQVLVKVTAPGFKGFEEARIVKAGNSIEVHASLVPDVAAEPAVADEPTADPGNEADLVTKAAAPPEKNGPLIPAWVGWTSIGVGAGLAALGGVFAASASSTAEDARTSDIYRPDLESSAEDARTRQWISLGTGVAFVAGGAAVLLLGGSRSGSSSDDSKLSFSPTYGNSGVGLIMSGRL